MFFGKTERTLYLSKSWEELRENKCSANYNKEDYSRAIEYLNKALKIYFKTLGPEHPYVAMVYENLAKAYEKKGDKKRAEEIRKRLGED